MIQTLCTVMKLVKGSYHRRTGRGGEGGAPPQILGNSDFLGQREKIWANQFFKTFSWFLNHYFEEMNIFYFNLKLA